MWPNTSQNNFSENDISHMNLNSATRSSHLYQSLNSFHNSEPSFSQQLQPPNQFSNYMGSTTMPSSMAYAQNQSHNQMASNGFHYDSTSNNINGTEINNVTGFPHTYRHCNLNSCSGQGQVPFHSYPHFPQSNHSCQVAIPSSIINANPLLHNDGTTHFYYNHCISSKTEGHQQKISNNDVTQSLKPKQQ